MPVEPCSSVSVASRLFQIKKQLVGSENHQISTHSRYCFLQRCVGVRYGREMGSFCSDINRRVILRGREEPEGEWEYRKKQGNQKKG